MIPELLNLLPKFDKESGIWRAEIGWDFIPGNGTDAINKDITFQEAFAEEPYVFAMSGVTKTTAGEPTSLADFNAGTGRSAINTQYPTTTGFRAGIVHTTSTFSASYYYGFVWVAFGKKA